MTFARGFAGLVLVAPWCALFASSAAGQPPQGPPAAPVRYAEAREHTLRRVVQLSGTVETAMASIVASETAGLVVEFPAREGSFVRRGAPLARLRTANLELQLQAAEADLQEAEARRQLGESDLARMQNLFEDKVVSQAELDGAVAEYHARQARNQALEAEAARLRDDMERSVIRAPFDGVVVAEHTEIGQWLAVGGPVVELHSLNPLEVVVDVPERYFAMLQRNVQAAVTFESQPGTDVDGRITAIVPRANPQTRTFPVRVRIANPDRRIGVGMLAQVSFPIGDAYQAVVVPRDAIVIQGSNRILYTIEGEQANMVQVRTGAGTGDWIAVEGGVAVGTRVVTRGNERLRPGQNVAGEPMEYRLP